MKRVLPAGVKQTSGGRYDPLERHIYFAASNPAHFNYADEHVMPYVLVAVNELHNETDFGHFENLIKSGRKLLLDSGIFSLANNHAKRHNMTHNEALNLAPDEIDGFDELFDAYIKIVSRYAEDLWGVIELDQGGKENKLKTRARLESEIPGFVPIPVYHPLGDGWDYFDQLAEGYDRICCGNIVQASSPQRVRLAYAFHERAKKYPYLWTHFLGYTPTGSTLSMPPQGSCDSSTWVGPVRWGVGVNKARSFVQPIGQMVYTNEFNRSTHVAASDPEGYDQMIRWAAYRSIMMTRTWQAIEKAKRANGLTTQPEAI